VLARRRRGLGNFGGDLRLEFFLGGTACFSILIRGFWSRSQSAGSRSESLLILLISLAVNPVI
jgi:hypothetical protein